MNKPKFSIIIAVYNSEKYLDETIESILKQTMDFKENIQVILVNDGSDDGSKEICERYVKLYPDNILYFEKKNGGPASAKNMGIEHAAGEYINFLDSDDKISENTLESVYNFFEKYKEKIDMVTLPIEYFDKKQGLHARYEKFNNQTSVINLDKMPTSYILSSAASFYKREVFDELKFDEKLIVAEDLYLNTQLYMKNPRFGILSSQDGLYYYRKRFETNSITNNNEYEENWLIEIFFQIYSNISTYCEKNNMKLPKFVKYILLEEITKRLKTPNFVSSFSLDEFYFISRKILADIDDRLILKYPSNNYYITLMLLMVKYNNFDIQSLISVDENNNLLIKNKPVGNLEDYSIKIAKLKLEDGKLVIEAFFNDIVPGNFEIYCRHSKQNYPMTLTEEENIFMQKRFFDKVIGKTYKAVLEMECTPGLYTFVLKTDNTETKLYIENIYGDGTFYINSIYNLNDEKVNLKMNYKKLFIKKLEKNL